MAVPLSDAARELADGANFATVATLNPDGGPQTSIVWITREGDDLLFSTARHRRKARNLERDPRVSITIVDGRDPYTHVEVRGRAELTDDRYNALGNELSHKYLGTDAPDDPEWLERVRVRVVPEKVVGWGTVGGGL
jgi:PPOX class probable F420-dependent enzyme